MDDYAVLLHVGFAANAVTGNLENQSALGSGWQLFVAIQTRATLGYLQCHAFNDVVASGRDQRCAPAGWVTLMLA